MPRVIKWLGNKECDFCHKEIKDILYDGMTTYGPWAVMCSKCFCAYGIRVAPGYGQMYKKNKSGDYVKVEG